MNKKLSRRNEIRISTLPAVLSNNPLNAPKIRDGRPATSLEGMVPGSVFGAMTVCEDGVVRVNCIKTDTGKVRSRYYVKVNCSCGNTLWVKTTYLKRRLPKSCKNCRSERRNGAFRTLPTEEAFWRNKLTDIKRRSRKNGIPFDITTKYVRELWAQQDGKCALSGWDLSTDDPYNLTLDKIIPKNGYCIGNVWWTHRKVNMVKQDLLLDDLVLLCKEIVKRFDKPSVRPI